jgi:hypothetical protein
MKFDQEKRLQMSNLLFFMEQNILKLAFSGQKLPIDRFVANKTGIIVINVFKIRRFLYKKFQWMQQVKFLKRKIKYK